MFAIPEVVMRLEPDVVRTRVMAGASVSVCEGVCERMCELGEDVKSLLEKTIPLWLRAVDNISPPVLPLVWRNHI